jgi:hypothetical protein
MEVFVDALCTVSGMCDGASTAEVVLGVGEHLLSSWREGRFCGWKEREGIVHALPVLIDLVRQEQPTFSRSLFKLALEDGAAAVREAAVSAVSEAWFFVSSLVFDA